MTLRILYRGRLASCNYGCEYCPFAKRVDSRADLERDAAELERFVAWVAAADRALGVFFTPWGEALIRKPYQRALVELTRMDHVERAAIQTNLSASLGWVRDVEVAKLGIWATYHPEWTSRRDFVDKVASLHERGVHVSAGVVGFKPFFGEIQALRSELPADVYLWVNANKRDPGYYSDDDIAVLEAIDPLFRLNTVAHPSAGRSCRAGADVVSVNGDGEVRRCHFIDEPIGNLYEPDFASALRERPCSNASCGCHIGYVHLDELGLAAIYGDGILERVPRVSPRALQIIS